jgi:hypothetical protein
MDTTTDINQIMTTVLAFAGSVVLGLVGLAVTRITATVKTWFAKKTVQDAVATAAGGVLVKLASGAMNLTQVTATHPVLATLADTALARVPDAAAALGVTSDGMAAMVVGAVGRALVADPTVPTVAVLPNLVATLPARSATVIASV